MKKLFLIYGAAMLVLASCSKLKPPASESPMLAKGTHLTYTGTDAEYINEDYGGGPRIFDIYIPDTLNDQPLVVFIHGGGFMGGDKSSAYSGIYNAQIQQFIDSGIAFTTINYELINIPDSEGMNKSLGDITEFFDFIQDNSTDYHIDKNRIAFYGNSAGGAAALWLSFNDSLDPYVCGGYNIQGTLDVIDWPIIFDPYSITMRDILKDYGVREYFYALFAVDSKTELEEATDYRASVDLLELMDENDAPFWMENNNLDSMPTNAAGLFHNPLHGKALYDTAQAVGLTNQCYVSEFSISDALGETLPEYFIRVLKE